MQVEITPACYRAIVSRSCLPFRDTGIVLANGNRCYLISARLVARVVERQLDGETFSATVERLCAVVDRKLT
jgi:hypothetical protein